jgi:mannitol/fructose-specific phosphotransferase system IIA component (Ntr-type)
MRLSETFEAGGVIVAPPWRTFEEAVRGMVTQLVASGQVEATLGETAMRAICEREATCSTAIVEIGVSVPHARMEGIKGLVAAFATSPTAVYLETAGVPIRIMVLVLSAPELAAQHLQFLAKISMLLQSESVRQTLLNASDSSVALAFLRAREGL